jgi:hypothetical protein
MKRTNGLNYLLVTHNLEVMHAYLNKDTDSVVTKVTRFN